jgi:hypothetical protein
MIYKNFTENIPESLRLNLEYTLRNSVNLTNRENKKHKFAFSTSEDALTWSFFSYFVINNRLKDLLELLNIDSNDSCYEIYLWGVNISSQIIKTDLFQQFIDTSNFFNEDKLKRTEPDVMIKLSNTLIFIEVKYKSPNEVKTDIEKFKKYLIPNIDTNKLFKSGHYELYRNWAFASKMSSGADFKIINLAPKKLFTDKNQIKLNLFEDSINSKNGKFSKISWEQIVDRMNKNVYDTWFIDYLNQKINAGDGS